MWVRLDDNFADHPKIGRLSDRAFRLYVTGLCYAGRHLTNGRLIRTAVEGFLAALDHQQDLLGNSAAVEQLERLGLWRVTAQGWTIHGFLKRNPSKKIVLAQRAAAKERQARSRARHSVSHTVSHAPVTAPRPDPSRSGTASTKRSRSSAPDKPAPPPQTIQSGRDDPPLASTEFFVVGERQVAAWAEQYPGVDVLVELDTAAAWLRARPRRKVKSYRRFLGNWLERAQEDAQARRPPPNSERQPTGWRGGDMRPIGEIIEQARARAEGELT